MLFSFVLLSINDILKIGDSMEVKYYGVPEGTECWKEDPMIAHPEEVLRMISKCKSELTPTTFKFKQDTDYGTDEEVYIMRSVLREKGMRIEAFRMPDGVANKPVCKVFIYDVDGQVHYVVTDSIQMYCPFNRDITKKLEQEIGPEREIPDLNVSFFKGLKLKRYIEESVAFGMSSLDNFENDRIKLIEDFEKKEIEKNIQAEKIKQLEAEMLAARIEYEKKLEALRNELSKVDSDYSVEREKVPAVVLFEKVDDHYEIREYFKHQNRLRNFDLSTFSFKDVNVAGLDLSETNAAFNPQDVYRKDLSNGHFEGVNFGFGSFNGVNITGATFGVGKEQTGSKFLVDKDKAIDETNQIEEQVVENETMGRRL